MSTITFAGSLIPGLTNPYSGRILYTHSNIVVPGISPLGNEWVIKRHLRLAYDQQSASMIAKIESDLSLVESFGIHIPNRDQIVNYLLDHLDMFSLTIETCLKTIIEFGKSAQLSFELYEDPEVDLSYLVLYIRQWQYSDGLIEEIRKFRSGLKRPKTGRILITTDFQPPAGK